MDNATLGVLAIITVLALLFTSALIIMLISLLRDLFE